MPWRHTCPLDQNLPCRADDLRRPLSITALCTRDGVSRQTGSQGLERSRTAGPPGLEARSRTPCCRPKQTPPHGVEAIMAVRGRHPAWGAKTLGSLVHPRPPRWAWPGRSTVGAILRRRGVVPTTRPRRLLGHPGQPTTRLAAPNAGGRADGHGQFHTRDGLSGDPVTGAAGDRRWRLGGQALAATRVAEAQPVFPRRVNAGGVPTRLRTDTGVPLAPPTRGRLSPLSAWGGRLGLGPERIAPGTLQQHGRHARLHRPRKAATTRPPARTRRAPQRTCARCREELNGQRPHEALDLPPPASGDAPSPRPRPHSLPPLADPDRFEGRSVSAHGGLRWHHQGGHVSPTGRGEEVGREDIADGRWQGDCGPLTRGRRLARHRRSAELEGRLPRHR